MCHRGAQGIQASPLFMHFVGNNRAGSKSHCEKRDDDGCIFLRIYVAPSGIGMKAVFEVMGSHLLPSQAYPDRLSWQ